MHYNKGNTGSRVFRNMLCLLVPYVFVCSACQKGPEEPEAVLIKLPAVVVGEAGVPLLAIHDENPRRTNPQVRFMLWPNGYIIWSDKVSTNTLLSSHITMKQRDQLLNRLNDCSVLLKGRNEEMGYSAPPDATQTVIRICRDGNIFTIRSSHALIEQNPNLIATPNGWEQLTNGTRIDAISQQPDNYKQLRIKWECIMAAIISVIPISGNPVDDVHSRWVDEWIDAK